VLNVNHAPVPNLSVPNYQCEPYCTIYNSHIKGQTELVGYTFNGGQTSYGDSTNICLSAGIYTVDVTSIGLNGCKEVFTYPNMLTIYPKPSADFSWTPSTPNTVSDNHVTFYPVNQNNNSTWFWELAANTTTTEKNPTVTYEDQGKYPITLVVITEYGCRDTVTKVLDIKDEFILWVPNAFTPNGDGLNEVFTGKGIGIKKFEMNIYDRWGNNVFQTNDIHKGWDGTFKGVLCKDDIFVYRISAIDNNGVNHTKTGHVTLMK
jgi:gliding motility-associated-like protein